MKKTLLLLAVAFTASQLVFGASIEWYISGINKALSNYDGSVAASTSVYLVLADSASLSTITGLEGADAATSFTEALSKITLSSVTSGTDGKKPASTRSVVSSDLISAGTQYTFGMLFVSEATDGAYYKYVTNPQTAYDISDPTSQKTTTLSWSDMNNASWTKGYTAVPEPASAMLALAGVAMLIRRRK